MPGPIKTSQERTQRTILNVSNMGNIAYHTKSIDDKPDSMHRIFHTMAEKTQFNIVPNTNKKLRCNPTHINYSKLYKSTANNHVFSIVDRPPSVKCSKSNTLDKEPVNQI
jgi:hypothetical protein